MLQIFKGLQAHFYTSTVLVEALHQLYQDTTPDGTPLPNARFTQVGNSIPRMCYTRFADPVGLDQWSFQFDVFAQTSSQACGLIDTLVTHYHKAFIEIESGQVLAIMQTGTRLMKDPGVDPNVKNVYHGIATFRLYTQDPQGV